VSFVEKALARLKQQEQEKPSVKPVGSLHFETPEDAPRQAQAPDKTAEFAAITPLAAPAAEAATSSELAAVSQEAAPRQRPAGTRATVHFDRDRFREEGFLASDDYERVKAEEYRRIKRPLLAHAFGVGATKIEDGNLVLVTSALSGEGKTNTCINLALSLATEKDRTVLLVDGDVPKPHISRLFGVDDQPGLMDALADDATALHDLLIRTDIESLSVLPAGSWNAHATELLASERMLKLCHELSTRYPDRIIIIDSPPLLAASEAQAIAAAVGQVVLVIAEGLTPRESVREALELVDERKPVNAVLNKSRWPSGSAYYGSGYGGYGSYGGRGPGEAREETPDGKN
jgi:exopolysaccharide/PEP-CTERM locus tyrosine autokinase